MIDYIITFAFAISLMSVLLIYTNAILMFFIRVIKKALS